MEAIPEPFIARLREVSVVINGEEHKLFLTSDVSTDDAIALLKATTPDADPR
jgi:hypothetical protein